MTKSLHYLPGCDVRKNHANATAKMERYMISKGAVIESCCRNEDLSNMKDGTVISNCTLCNLMIHERLVDTENISLYEYLLLDEAFPWPKHTGQSITIQDCYRAVKYPNMQRAIRQCLKKMDYTIVELEENYENTKFCGVWKYNTPNPLLERLAPYTFAQLHEEFFEILPAEEQVKCMQTWVQQYQTEQVLVYCNGCEKGLRLGGINPVHMIELLTENL